MSVGSEQIKGKEYSFRKSTCERYDIHWDRSGWAIITIDETGGMFNAQSDYGNYSYSWPHHGRKSFKHYIILDLVKDPEYFLGKVSSETHFDFEQNLQSWKQTIIESRKKGSCSKEGARTAWNFVTGLEDYSGSYQAIQMLFLETKDLAEISDEPWYTFEISLDYPPMAKKFAKEVLPMFAEIINKEIMEEVGETILCQDHY